jgi:hypothetical protein
MTLKEEYAKLAEETQTLNRAYGLAVMNRWFSLAMKLEPLLEDFATRRDTLKAQIEKEKLTRHTQPIQTLIASTQTLVPATLTVTVPNGARNTAFVYSLTGEIVP